MKMTDSRHSLWVKLLDGIDDHLVASAATHILSSRSDWPPDIALLRTTALALEAGDMAAPSGAESWASARPFLDGKNVPLAPRERAAIKALGIMDGDEQNLASTRARYIEAYDNIAARDKAAREMLPEIAALNAKSAEVPELAPDIPPGMGIYAGCRSVKECYEYTLRRRLGSPEQLKRWEQEYKDRGDAGDWEKPGTPRLPGRAGSKIGRR
ncbi:MAG: hypothetical protein U9Q07_03750 [Planctomycetota bacterium]|nr:hypothetical protein [Planctomycetota bacterium]